MFSLGQRDWERSLCGARKVGQGEAEAVRVSFFFFLVAKSSSIAGPWFILVPVGVVTINILFARIIALLFSSSAVLMMK